MLFNNAFRIFFVTSVIFCQGYGQDVDNCVSEGVQLFGLEKNGTLWWRMDEYTACEVTNFLVNIYGDDENEYDYNITEYSLDVSFLKKCLKWRFTVVAVSNGVIGGHHSMDSYFPFPSDEGLDFVVSDWNINETEEGVTVSWDVENEPTCPLEYQVSIYDGELGLVAWLLLEQKFINLNHLYPCGSYSVDVRVINAAVSENAGASRNITFEITPKPQPPPSLQAIDIYATSVNTTWRLEGNFNRCPLTAFYVTSSNFNKTIPLEDSGRLEWISVEMKPLLPNTMYFFQVSVENSAGISQISQMAVQTLR